MHSCISMLCNESINYRPLWTHSEILLFKEVIDAWYLSNTRTFGCLKYQTLECLKGLKFPALFQTLLYCINKYKIIFVHQYFVSIMLYCIKPNNRITNQFSAHWQNWEWICFHSSSTTENMISLCSYLEHSQRINHT